MGNTVNRQAAIDAIKAFLRNEDDWYREAGASVIRKLPDEPEDEEIGWRYNEDTKEITVVVPLSVYNSAKTVYLSPGECMSGLRERTYFRPPEYRTDEWCTDCKEYDHEKHSCPRFNRVIRTTIEDAKEAAYSAGYIEAETEMFAACDDCKEKRIIGSWLMNGGRPCECPICHHEGNMSGKDLYCGHCGARLELPQEEDAHGLS